MYHPDNISEVKRNQPIFNRCVIFLIQQIKAYMDIQNLYVLIKKIYIENQ